MSKKSKMVSAELMSSLQDVKQSITEKNDISLWVIRLVMVVLAAVIVPLLPVNTLEMVDNTIVRVVAVTLVVILSLYDPASGIVMAVGLIVAMQMLHRERMTDLANATVVSTNPTPTRSQQQQKPLSAPAAAHPQLQPLPTHTGFTQPRVNLPVHQESLNESYADFPQDASMGSFTTPQQFLDAQSNEVANNQNTEVRTWTNEMGPQGLSSIMGFNSMGHLDLLSQAFPL
jgi:hypothetical protein